MPLTTAPRICITLAGCALLAACSTPEGDFPSLEKRPYETNDPIAEPAEMPVEAATELPPALKAKADALLAQYRAGQAAFDRGLPEVRRIAAGAAGKAPGNDVWVNAHLRLSRLDKERAESVRAVAAIDDLVSETEDEDLKGGPANAPLLKPVQTEIGKGVAAQNDIIDQLSRQIGE